MNPIEEYYKKYWVRYLKDTENFYYEGKGSEEDFLEFVYCYEKRSGNIYFRPK